MTLDKNDYLIHQLYTASKSPQIKKSRLKRWIFTTITFGILSALFFESNNNSLGYYFLIISLISLALYPLYSSWLYKRHYKQHIESNFKNKTGMECTLEIQNEMIQTKDATGELKINTSEIEEINEITDYYFIKIKTGASVIISKAKTNSDELKIIEDGLKNLITSKGIKHNKELNWKWR